MVAGGVVSDGLIEVRRTTAAGAAAVWAVLADGWRLPSWVVGAARVEAVDPAWPAVGAGLRYSIGAWPLLVGGVARVAVGVPGRELVLHGAAPVGRLQVQLVLEPSGSGCEIVMREDVVGGPGRLVPRPLRAAGIRARNAETLYRLAAQAEAPSP